MGSPPPGTARGDAGCPRLIEKAGAFGCVGRVCKPPAGMRGSTGAKGACCCRCFVSASVSVAVDDCAAGCKPCEGVAGEVLRGVAMSREGATGTEVRKRLRGRFERGLLLSGASRPLRVASPDVFGRAAPDAYSCAAPHAPRATAFGTGSDGAVYGRVMAQRRAHA